MHSAQLIFLPSFKSVKVNGSHYVCSPPTLARRHTDMHTQSIQSHYFWRVLLLCILGTEKGVEGDACYSLEPLPGLRADEKLE